MKLNEGLLHSTAAMLVTGLGFTPVGYWYVGSETHYYIFNSPDGKGYYLDFGGGDNPYLDVTAHRADFWLDLDMFEDSDSKVFEGNPFTKVWELEFDEEPEDTYQLGLNSFDEGYQQHHLDLWLIGALTAFLYQLKGGLLNG